jgi:hypothetical protein
VVRRASEELPQLVLGALEHDAVPMAVTRSSKRLGTSSWKIPGTAWSTSSSTNSAAVTTLL